MRNNKKFIIGFVIFDALLIIGIVLYIVIANPFSDSVAPSVTPTTKTTTPAESGTGSKKKGALSKVEELSMESMQVMTQEPALMGLREEANRTEDGLYYTDYLGYTESDVDGDGENEYFSISLDDHSESFYVLARKGDKVVDYVVPGTEYSFNDAYGAKVCKGELRGFTVDLNSSDKYTEIGVILMRDNWKEYDTIIARFDGEKIYASRVHGFLSGLSDSSGVQFATYDTIYGIHKLYRNYSIVDDTDFLSPQGDYFAELNVERTSYLHNLDFEITCTNLKGEQITLKPGTSFYWGRTDNATFVDMISTDGYVYRLPVREEVVHYDTGDQSVYYLGDKVSSDIYTKA